MKQSDNSLADDDNNSSKNKDGTDQDGNGNSASTPNTDRMKRGKTK